MVGVRLLVVCVLLRSAWCGGDGEEEEHHAPIGFCLNVVPHEIEDTGFAANSSLNETQCKSKFGSSMWCPLTSELTPYPVINEEGKKEVIMFYWFSPCCTGRQGSRLITDD